MAQYIWPIGARIEAIYDLDLGIVLTFELDPARSLPIISFASWDVLQTFITRLQQFHDTYSNMLPPIPDVVLKAFENEEGKDCMGGGL